MMKRFRFSSSLSLRHVRFYSSNSNADASETAAAAARELLRAGLRARREAAAFGEGDGTSSSPSIDSNSTSTSSSSSSTSSTSSSSSPKLAAALVQAHARAKATPLGETRFVSVLCSDFGVDREELRRAIEAWQVSTPFSTSSSSSSSSTSSTSSSSSDTSSSTSAAAATEERLRRASTPAYESFWPAVAGVPGGLATLAELRAAALSSQKEEAEGGERGREEERGHAYLSSSPRRRAALAASLARSLAPALAAGTSLIRLGAPGATKNDGEEATLLSEAASKAQRSLHPVRSERDWRMRLQPPRACFALLHERGFGRGVPLATVACFSGEKVARKVSEVLPKVDEEGGRGEEESFPPSSSFSAPVSAGGPSATLYALCSAHSGLGGLEVGRAAARGAAEALARGGSGSGGSGERGGGEAESNLPAAMRIATLSPLPGFLPWLRAIGRGGGGGIGGSRKQLEFRREEEEAIREAAAAGGGGGGGGGRRVFGNANSNSLALLLSTLEAEGGRRTRTPPPPPPPPPSPSLPPDLLGPVLLRLAARFVALETVRGLPLDPVARFHAANGAALARLCWRGDDGNGDGECDDNGSDSGNPLLLPRARRISSESAGILVNYSYLWPAGEEPLAVGRSSRGGGAGIKVSEGVARLLQGGGGGLDGGGGGGGDGEERWGLVD